MSHSSFDQLIDDVRSSDRSIRSVCKLLLLFSAFMLLVGGALWLLNPLVGERQWFEDLQILCLALGGPMAVTCSIWWTWLYLSPRIRLVLYGAFWLIAGVVGFLYIPEDAEMGYRGGFIYLELALGFIYGAIILRAWLMHRAHKENTTSQ